MMFLRSGTFLVFGVLALLVLILAASPVRAQDKAFTDSLGLEFVLIPAGSFMMGSEENAKSKGADQIPKHKVNISQSFYLGKYEVTQAQWTKLMGSNPSKYKGDNNPVDHVSWEDAQEFIKRLNAKVGHGRYRLPTEAEWEYAVRAGSDSEYSFGDDIGQLDQHAWFGDQDKGTHPVGQKKPNSWGLYDMHGNVLEWVQDWYGEGYYANSPSDDPGGPTAGSERVLRGGSWAVRGENSRSANRIHYKPSHRGGGMGLRLALSVK